MDDTKWGSWLRAVTREDTVRGIARAAGVSHTTVQRWIVKGVPLQTAWELTVRFRGDPVETLIVSGRVTPEQVPFLNFSACVRHVSTSTLTAELHRRALEGGIHPARSDSISRQSFRLTSK